MDVLATPTDYEKVVVDAQEINLKSATIADRVRMYTDIREALSCARKEFETFEDNAKDMMARISMSLRDTADELGVDNFKTQYGTAYRNTKTSYRAATGGWDDFLDFVKENNAFNMIQKRVTKEAVKEYHDATGEIPPGLDYIVEVEFNVRKS